MLKENEINVGDTHSAVLVDDPKRTQIVQYAEKAWRLQSITYR